MDKDSFEQVYIQYHKVVYAYLLSLCRSEELAADLAQLILFFYVPDADYRFGTGRFTFCHFPYPLPYTVSIKVFSMRLNRTTPRVSTAAVQTRL